jgi:hypothetical protein
MLETVAFTGPMLDAGHWMLVEDPAMRESETNGPAVKNLQRSDGVLECWSSGLKFEDNLSKEITDGISEVLSFALSVTPLLQYSREHMKCRQTPPLRGKSRPCPPPHSGIFDGRGFFNLLRSKDSS